ARRREKQQQRHERHPRRDDVGARLELRGPQQTAERREDRPGERDGGATTPPTTDAIMPRGRRPLLRTCGRVRSAIGAGLLSRRHVSQPKTRYGGRANRLRRGGDPSVDAELAPRLRRLLLRLGPRRKRPDANT